MQKWEYLHIFVNWTDRKVKEVNGNPVKVNVNLTDYIKNLGIDGWEMTGIAAAQIFFKKPIE